MRYKAGMMTGAAALLVVIGGCTKKPGGEVVAVVNGEEITQKELNTELQGANVPEGTDQKKIMPALLQRVIDRKLVVQLARKEGLDKTPAFVAQEHAMQENLLANQYAQTVAKATGAPDAAAVDSFISGNPTIFSQRKRYALTQIVFAPPADPTILPRLQAAHSLEAMAALLTTAHVPFARGIGNLDTASIPPELAARIAALPPGEPFLLPDNGRIVASAIQQVQPLPVPPEEAKAAAANMIRQKSLQDAVSKKLEAARSSATISYQPGFAPPPTQSPGP